MEQHNYVTKENIAILISIFGLLISVCTYLLSRKKLQIDKLAFKREFYLGTEKLRELLTIIKPIQNIDPTNLTYAKFVSDKKLFDALFKKYIEYEDRIVKTSYTIPNNINDTKRYLGYIEDNYNGKVKKDFFTPEKELLFNYRSLFFYLSLLAMPVNSIDKTNKQYREEDDYGKYFMELYMKFEQYGFYLDNLQWKNLMNEFEDLKKELNLTSKVS